MTSAARASSDCGTFRPSTLAVFKLPRLVQRPNTATLVQQTQTAVDQLGVKLAVELIDGPQAIGETTFETMKAVIAQPIFTGYQKEIVAMAMKNGLPVISDWALFARAGALFTYVRAKGANSVTRSGSGVTSAYGPTVTYRLALSMSANGKSRIRPR
jgi:hypothetical protein